MSSELFLGSIGGLTGYLVCHPTDTIKTRMQTYPNYSILQDCRTNGFRTFFKGLPSPLTSVILEKALLFGAYEKISKSTNSSNSFLNGIGAGLLTTLTVTPFERVKIIAQTSKHSTFNSLKTIIAKDGLHSLYRGWSATLLREVPGYGIYFWSYERSKKLFPNYTPLTALATGAISGVSAWIFIYPSDPVKTLMQRNNIGPRQAIKQIYNDNGIGGFYRGYLWGLSRAAILHGGVFLGYETAKFLTTQST